jgi:hypothetical protein
MYISMYIRMYCVEMSWRDGDGKKEGKEKEAGGLGTPDVPTQ